MPRVREYAKSAAQRAFLVGDRLGVHVLPAHYYSSVASRAVLRQTEPQWRRPLHPMPFEWDVAAQSEWLRAQVQAFPAELPMAGIIDESQSVGGFRYGPVEAQMLYGYIRTNAPRKIVEIGSGSSTLIMSKAVGRNVAEGREPTEILAFDPYTAERVRGLAHVQAQARGGSELEPAELGLAAGDVLFIDSTHTVRTGSELAHLYLELLPQLAAGVVIHIHDIVLPYLFGPDLYTSMFDWQETTLVAALLAGNSGFRILCSLSGLYHEAQGVLADVFPEFRAAPITDGLWTSGAREGHFPSSLWLAKS